MRHFVGPERLVLAARVPHRLYGVLAADRPGSAGSWLAMAQGAIDEARARGGKFVVLIPIEYVENFRGTAGIEIIGDNGRTAVLGWKP